MALLVWDIPFRTDIGYVKYLAFLLAACSGFA